jgi:asparagine synthase (glutamine-hydrolysing)
MCGISAYISRKDELASLRESLLRIAHRGPDYSGIQNLQTVNGWKLGLGHNRLSIIDMSENGNQPMLSANGQIYMVYNGEIYNFESLKKRLPNHNWKSHSDSEVLLELYAQEGEQIFSLLRGMFAVVFYHVDTGELCIVRDQLGIKPLYYAIDDEGFYLSSEIRGLSPFFNDRPWRVDRSGLFQFLNNGFVYDPDTGIEGVRKIEPGHYVKWHNGNVKSRSYFNLSEATSELHPHYEANAAIEHAVNSHLISDAKIGLLFSGGMDSTAIAVAGRMPLLFAEYNEEAIRLSGRINEKKYAAEISSVLGLPLDLQPMASNSDSAFLSTAAMTAIGNEELISDYTFISSKDLCQVARNIGYKVMLSGMGADEAYMGYPRYTMLRKQGLLTGLNGITPNLIINWMGRFPAFAKKVERYQSFFSEKQLALGYTRLLGYLNREEIDQMMGQEPSQWEKYKATLDQHLCGFEKDDPIVQMAALDVKGFLAHNLMVADKSSMQASVELRVPFVDLDFYCGLFAQHRRMPESRKAGKGPLRAFVENTIPKSLTRRPKVGFNPPLDQAIQALGQHQLIEIIRDSNFGQHLNINFAEQTIRAHFRGEGNHTYKLWQFLYLSYWFEGKAV